MAESGDPVNHFAHLHPEGEEEKMHLQVQVKADAPLCSVEAAESEYQPVQSRRRYSWDAAVDF